MTSPRSTYGGGYYAAPSFADTPIYDSLVAERGTPQIAPIRVPSAYESGSQLPALPAALPALSAGPGAPSPAPRGYGYPQPTPQAPPPYQAPAPYVPQQNTGERGYGVPQPAAPAPAPYAHPQQPQPQQMRPVAPRPAAPRPMPAPAQTPYGGYDDPYGRQHPAPGY
ncbi:DUF6643 family protein [Streptomyces sp. TRM 70351]|uniref:DUF6643 family protein n=1 Tax=Streptomyces sp. TRM 70351 TaxID=3116552 RepID=UPI002E7B3ACA|nr:DUF6643 family protein [Streptomyces sp. TRM 70351]MEE1927277.1 DUF6643 family protein [Streptomyces sp. TRM 70351]